MDDRQLRIGIVHQVADDVLALLGRADLVVDLGADPGSERRAWRTRLVGPAGRRETVVTRLGGVAVVRLGAGAELEPVPDPVVVVVLSGRTRAQAKAVREQLAVAGRLGVVVARLRPGEAHQVAVYLQPGSDPLVTVEELT